MAEEQINIQDLFAIIGEQSLTIRLLQQRLATMQKSLDDLQKGPGNEESNIS